MAIQLSPAAQWLCQILKEFHFPGRPGVYPPRTYVEWKHDLRKLYPADPSRAIVATRGTYSGPPEKRSEAIDKAVQAAANKISRSAKRAWRQHRAAASKACKAIERAYEECGDEARDASGWFHQNCGARHEDARDPVLNGEYQERVILNPVPIYLLIAEIAPPLADGAPVRCYDDLKAAIAELAYYKVAQETPVKHPENAEYVRSDGLIVDARSNSDHKLVEVFVRGRYDPNMHSVYRESIQAALTERAFVLDADRLAPMRLDEGSTGALSFIPEEADLAVLLALNNLGERSSKPAIIRELLACARRREIPAKATCESSKLTKVLKKGVNAGWLDQLNLQSGWKPTDRGKSLMEAHRNALRAMAQSH